MFWENYSELCKKKEVSPNKAAAEIGISSGSVTAWKNGRLPRSAALIKIAEYFDVTVEDLLSKKEKPADNVSEPIDQTDQTIMNLLKLFPQEERQAIIAELAARLAEKK